MLKTIFRWSDHSAPAGTRLTVNEKGFVCYYYGGSWEANGQSDVGAVLRAVKAWKEWEKPQGMQFSCIPTTRRQVRFYRKFGIKILA